ncbi:MAG TPA: helix-turn-helix domain-containing protein, partial [Longimicrobiaceae bacterium]|nr:helix-turn-helix domain-containing protein [Longimicrobiaceae bacterium]
ASPARDARSGYTAFLLRPPYATPSFAPAATAIRALGETPGCLIGILLTRADPDWTEIERFVLALRVRFAFAPVVLLLRLPQDESVYVSSRAGRLKIRAVVAEGQPLGATLRRSLTATDGLGEDVVEWLDLQRVRLSPSVRHLLRSLISGAAKHGDVTSVLRQIGTPESTARFQLHKRRLPAPGRWFQAGRALHATLRLQAEPERPLLSLALEMGYADHSALSQLVHRTFGMRPGRLRQVLGWEWLMHRWLRTHIPAAAMMYPETQAPRDLCAADANFSTL